MIITAPKIIKVRDISNFLSKIEEIFNMTDTFSPKVEIDLSKIRSLNVVGLLIIYKLIEYTHTHNCFINPRLKVDDYIIKKWYDYGFINLIEAYIYNKSEFNREKSYKNLKVKIEDNFFIAPQPLMRNDKDSNQILKKVFFPKISEYYSFNEKIISMIFQCISEIFLNFWAHAIDDSKSILIAEGNKQFIEIACADTGNGIISTLGKTINEKEYLPHEILLRAISKGVSSKKMTNHMGYGLWIIDEIASLTGGSLNIYSQGAYYFNNTGKKESGKCAYWQGTIVYLKLPLSNPKTLVDIEGTIEGENDLKINW